MIKDYELYNKRMSRTLFDKAFFIDKIYGVEVVVDFGCADGSLVRYLNELFPIYTYVGYDIDSTMIDLARIKTPQSNIYFASSLEELKPFIRGKKWAINFSSVLHEMDVHSLEAIEAFIKEMRPNYICARDMYYSCKNLSFEAKEKIEKEELWKDYMRGRVISDYSYNHIEYLLKRTYIENWEKEKQERYFSAFHKFDLFLWPRGYKTIWEVKYCLPYQKLQWLKDFNFDYSKERFTTHKQLIISNMFNLKEG